MSHCRKQASVLVPSATALVMPAPTSQAVAFAERQGWPVSVQDPHTSSGQRPRHLLGWVHSFSSDTHLSSADVGASTMHCVMQFFYLPP